MLLGFVLCQLGTAQNFNKAIEGASNLIAARTIEKISSDRFLIFSANFSNNRLGISSILINNNGDTLFSKKYRRNQQNLYLGWASSSYLTHDSSIIIGGGIQDTSDFAHMMKYTKYGDTIWTKTFGDTSNFDAFYNSIEDNQKNIIAVGVTDRNGNIDGWAVKTDSNGVILWERVYSKTSTYREGFTAIYETSDGGYIVSGYIQDRQRASPNDPLYINDDPLVIKLDSNGLEEWSYIYDTPFNEATAFVIQTLDGNYVFGSSISVSQVNNVSSGNGRAALFKLDTSGSLMWAKTYGFVSRNHSFQKVLELPDSSLIAIGRRMDPTNSDIEGLIVKTDPNGDSIWVNSYEFDPIQRGQNYLWDIAEMYDGGFLAVGETIILQPSTFRQDTWVIRVDSNGCILQNCTVNLQELQYVSEEVVFYPNPSNGLISLNTDVEISELRVFDQLGREVQLFNNIGSNFKWNLPHESGLYLIHWLDIEGKSGTEKVIKNGN